MVKSVGLIFATGLCLLGPAMTLAQGTFFLKEEAVETVSSPGFNEQQARWLVRVEKPEDLKGLPKGLSQRMYFYSGTVGDRDVLAMIESGKNRQLFIDLDGDKDLSDEKPIPFKRMRSTLGFGWSQSYRFGPVSLRTTSTATDTVDKPSPDSKDTETNDDEPTAGMFYAEQFDLDYLLIRAAVCRRGTVRIDGKSYSTLLTDGNFNGHYDDTFRFAVSREDKKQKKDDENKVDETAVSCDYLGIDLNRNNRFDRDEFWGAEVQALTKLIQLNNSYYSVEVAADGSTITLDEGQPELGRLDIGKQQADIMVMSENGAFSLKVREDPVKLPVGRYRLAYVVLRGADSKKVLYALGGRAPDTKVCQFEVTKDKTTELKFGPPLTMTTSQRTLRTLYSGQVVSFGIRCTDNLGIEYKPGADRAGRIDSAPSVRILDEKGKTLSAGQFEYG